MARKRHHAIQYLANNPLQYMAVFFSLSFPIVILCLFVSFHGGLGYSQSQDLVLSFLPNYQVVPRPINKHHRLNGNGDGSYQIVATVYPYGAFKFWEGECFKDNKAYLTYTRDHGLGYVIVDVSHGRSAFCKDYYQFKAGDRLLAEDDFLVAGTLKRVAFDSSDKELRKYIKANGVDIYLWKSSGDQLQKQEEKVMEPLTSTDGGATSAI
ncbi:hypothetical protein Tsubulata_040407 [Turnera subulata]|uniref:Uncharacterized protein n=1 Tax=Turnera subulata TaxID=218843 RepID=A0A9Q0FH62_9ROSI|nr:hypothetical protein Tsubulata_040407 [Turnera subulata]